MINFPQLPQKMVIKYTKDRKIKKGGEAVGRQQRQMQLTLNIPTYTKCAKIYQNLMLVVKKVDANRQIRDIGDRKDGKNAVGKAGEKDKLNLSYVDQLVQYELRLVLKSINKQITGGPAPTTDKDKNKGNVQGA